MAKDFSDKGGLNLHGNSSKKWDEYVARYKWRKGWNRLRLFGLAYTDARHNNIPTKNGKAYAEFCHGYDSDNDQYYSDRNERCEACRLGFAIQVRYFVNVLDIDAWEQRPANLPPNWNPIYMVDLPPSLMRSLLELKQLNKGHVVGDPLKGAIVNVKYDPAPASPANTYGVSLGEKFVFDDEMKALTFSQETLDGERVVRKGTDLLPPAWVYYPCRSSRDDMVRSLKNHGHLDATEVSSEPESPAARKAKNQAQSILSQVAEDEAPAPRSRSNLKDLAKLSADEETDDVPLPRKFGKAAAPVVEEALTDDEIPF